MNGPDGNPLFLERLSRVAPFGVCFRDVATGKAVGDGLNVTAFPPGDPDNVVPGFPNRQGVNILAGLPGLHEVEYGSGDQKFWDSLPPRRPFVLQVTDTRSRYQPFRLPIDLPVRDLFPWEEEPGASPPGPVPCIPLYPAPSQKAPAGFGVVRAELLDSVSDTPAAWAMVEAFAGEQRIGRSYSDMRGRVMVLFPYPGPQANVFGSPADSSPPEGTVRFTDSQWTILLRVLYSPRPVPPPIPDLTTVHQQPQALVLFNQSPPVSELESKLEFGRELILRSPSRSDLLIVPAGSPR